MNYGRCKGCPRTQGRKRIGALNGTPNLTLLLRMKRKNVALDNVISTESEIPSFGGHIIMSFSDMVVGKNGLLVELRCHNSFNEKIYTDIINYLSKHLPEWKTTGSIPIADAVPIFNLIASL